MSDKRREDFEAFMSAIQDLTEGWDLPVEWRRRSKAPRVRVQAAPSGRVIVGIKIEEGQSVGELLKVAEDALRKARRVWERMDRFEREELKRSEARKDWGKGMREVFAKWGA